MEIDDRGHGLFKCRGMDALPLRAEDHLYELIAFDAISRIRVLVNFLGINEAKGTNTLGE